jgi:hypothetical protein
MQRAQITPSEFQTVVWWGRLRAGEPAQSAGISFRKFESAIQTWAKGKKLTVPLTVSQRTLNPECFSPNLTRDPHSIKIENL